jgi:opacity protein-like surface antigen
MSFPCWISPMRRVSVRVSVLAAAVFLAASLASAQSDVAPNQSNAPTLSAGESSSLQVASAADPGNLFADPAAPTPAGGAAAAGGQEYGGHGLWQKTKSNFAFEAGGGFNAPESNSITYGGNFTVGGGVNLNKHLAVLAEYQFIDDKLPGSLIAEAEAQGGHAHVWSLTLDPVLDLFPKAKNDVYVTGGGGFYRKVSSFTDPEEEEVCYYFCEVYDQNVVIAHFSSNQGGWNIGAGFQHRLGGMYGDSKTKLFAEARYVDVLSPAVTGLSPNGSGLITTVEKDTKMIPVTLGVRF